MWSLECEPGLEFTAPSDGAWHSLVLFTLEHKPLQGERSSEAAKPLLTDWISTHTPSQALVFYSSGFQVHCTQLHKPTRISLEAQSREAK